MPPPPGASPLGNMLIDASKGCKCKGTGIWGLGATLWKGPWAAPEMLFKN